jgi:Orsellinic acid/F9775 biosynthesis cluster protein D
MFDPKRLASLGLRIDYDHTALICLVCKCALPVTGSCLTSHLWEKHKIPKDLRAGLTSHVRSLQITDPSELPILPDGCPPHPDLRVYRVYVCKSCGHKSTSQDIIGRHLSRNHQRSKKALERYTDIILCQSWVLYPTAREWAVDNTATVTCSSLQPSSNHLREMHNEEMAIISQHSQLRELDPSDTGLDIMELTSPWMNRTKWPRIYQDCRRDILVRLSEVGSSWFHSRDVRLDRRDNPNVVSLARNEAKIWVLLQGIDQALDRCEETMRRTGRPILCWLASIKPGEFCPRPFAFLGRAASRQRYRRLWKKFIAFIFRLYCMPAAKRWSVFRIKLTSDQFEWLTEIWEDRCWDFVGLDTDSSSSSEAEGDCAVSDDDSDNEEEGEEDEGADDGQNDPTSDWNNDRETADGHHVEDTTIAEEMGLQWPELDLREEVRVVDLPEIDLSAESAKDRISELVFRLSISFATEEFIDGQPHSSLLVYFSGILGLLPDGKAFRRAKDYTPSLSGLIYIQRLLFLEYALPHKGYKHITLGERPRQDHLGRLNKVRLQYMVQGCLSPLGEFQSLRDYGRVIARTDPPAFMFRWSDDDQTLYYGNEHLSMRQFRELASRIISSAAMTCARLMYDWQPKVNLDSIKDDLCNLKEGFSFVHHPSNKLGSAYLDLSARACMDPNNALLVNDKWDWTAAWRYLKLEEELLELLLAMLYVLGGQAPRSTEILGLESCNGPSTERGIYVYDGSMIYVTRHHKARKVTNREFNVVRYLPNQAGKILFYYLVYIRPFAEMILRRAKVSGQETRGRLLFRSFQASSQLWSSQRLSTVLQKMGSGILQKPFGVQLYRQISISITEKHVQRLAKPFNRHDDKSVAADINVVFAWQSGHRPLQRSTTYGLDGAFPTRLQPALLRVYKWASKEWHEFLLVDSDNSPTISAMLPKASTSNKAAVSDESSTQPTVTQERRDQTRLATSRKRINLPWEGRPVQQTKRQRTSPPNSVDGTDTSQSFHAHINNLAIPLPEEAAKCLTWHENSNEALPTDRLLKLLYKWAQRCNLCYFQRRSLDVCGYDHGIISCKEYGAESVQHQEKALTSSLERHIDAPVPNFCIDCCLPGDWHMARETKASVMRMGLWGPTCIFMGTVAEAIAVLLSNNMFLEVVHKWKERDAGQDDSKKLRDMDTWLTNIIQWGKDSVPLMLRVFFQLAEFSEWCERHEKR